MAFDTERRVLTGLYYLYNHFGFKGGEMLVFEYYGGSDFIVYIIGMDGSEIEYPYNVHHS